MMSTPKPLHDTSADRSTKVYRRQDICKGKEQAASRGTTQENGLEGVKAH